MSGNARHLNSRSQILCIRDRYNLRKFNNGQVEYDPINPQSYQHLLLHRCVSSDGSIKPNVDEQRQRNNSRFLLRRKKNKSQPGDKKIETSNGPETGKEEIRQNLLRFLLDRQSRPTYKNHHFNDYDNLNTWAEGWPKEGIEDDLRLASLRRPQKMVNHMRQMDTLDRACEYYSTLTGFSHQDFEGELINLFDASVGDKFLELRRQLEKGGGCHWMFDDSMTNTVAEYILRDQGLDECHTPFCNEDSTWLNKKGVYNPQYFLW